MDGKQIQALLLKEGITACTIEYKGEQRIKLSFANDSRLTGAVKKIAGRKWSKTLPAWHIPRDKKLLEELLKNLSWPAPTVSLKNSEPPDLSLQKDSPVETATHPALIPYLQRLTDKISLKGYSYSTLKNYHSHFASYLKVVHSRKDVDSITKEEIEKYLRWRQKHKTYSDSDQNSHINAIKFYYEVVLGRERMLFNLPRPKKPEQLPAVWAEQDVIKMIRTVSNLKHKVMLLMAYAHGMRVSEVAELKLADMDSKRMQIHIKAAKGKKDRVVNLSETVLVAIKSYYKEYKPKIYLFENDLTGEPISTRTIQEVFKAAKKKAGLIKKAGIHSLRHSYATHLHEQGVDIKFLKELLGHNSLRTTEQYTHVSKKDISKIKSPLDNLKL